MMHRLVLVTMLLSEPLAAAPATKTAPETYHRQEMPVASNATVEPKRIGHPPIQAIAAVSEQENTDRKAREAKAEKHDAEDLDAQIAPCSS
jgi:hypothetical protein